MKHSPKKFICYGLGFLMGCALVGIGFKQRLARKAEHKPPPSMVSIAKAFKETAPDDAGIFLRTLIMERPRIQDWIHLEETIGVDTDGREYLIKRRIYAADRLLIRVHPEANETAVQDVLTQANARLIEKRAAGDMWLIGLAAPTLEGIPETIALLKRHPQVIEHAAPLLLPEES